MSNITYLQVQAMMVDWVGTPEQKRAQWERTYNWTIWQPPPFVFGSDNELAKYIADHYTGPVIA
jgi:hypothetical protein